MSVRAARVLVALACVPIFPTAVGSGSAGASIGARSAFESVPGACTSAGEVTVVVDGGALGGGVRVGCASDPATGREALTQAGFTVTPVIQGSGFFVCRIDGQPTAATESCIVTPPATRYWSYWYALPGAGWTYSSLGAAARTPPAGSVEGWSFASSSDGSPAPPPRIAPPFPASPATSVDTSPPATTPGGGPATTVPSAGRPSGSPTRPASPRAGVPSAGPGPANGSTVTVASPPESGSPTTTLPTAAAGGAAATTTVVPSVRVEAAQTSRSTGSGRGSSSGSSSGAAAGSILALLAIVAAGTGAGIVSRRRARAQ